MAAAQVRAKVGPVLRLQTNRRTCESAFACDSHLETIFSFTTCKMDPRDALKIFPI
jgi:hypothetical protein